MSGVTLFTAVAAMCKAMGKDVVDVVDVVPSSEGIFPPNKYYVLFKDETYMTMEVKLPPTAITKEGNA